MNWDLLKEMGIEETDPSAIKDALGEKQIELEDRRDKAEANGNEDRKEELEAKLTELVTLLEELAKNPVEVETPEPPKASHGVLSTAIDTPKVRGVVPTSVSGDVAPKKSKKEVFDNKLFDKNSVIDKDHEKALKEKANSIRKSAEKAKEEKAEEVAAAESASTLSTSKEETKVSDEGKETKPEASPTTGLEAELDDAIKLYMKNKYDEAFTKMLGIANKGDEAGLDKEKHGIAEFYSGMMYEGGKGVKKDIDRALFWYRKAAEHKNVDACLAGARIVSESVPMDAAEQYKKWGEVLSLLYIAGMGGSKAAKENYASICTDKFDWIGIGEKVKALHFLDMLIQEEEDEYEKQEYRKKRDVLRKKRHAKNTTKIRFDFSEFLTVIGAVLILWFALSHSFYWGNVESPAILNPTQGLLQKLHWINGHRLGELAYGVYSDYEMVPLFVVACIGWLLTGLSAINQRTRVTNFICELSMFVSAIAVSVSSILTNQSWQGDIVPLGVLIVFAISKMLGVGIRNAVAFFI